MRKMKSLGWLPLLAGTALMASAFGAIAKDSYTIGISNTVQGNGWREEMVCAMKAQALASGKVTKLNIAHRNTDAAGQGGLHVNVARGERPVETFAVTLEPAGMTAGPTGPMVLVSKPT